MRKIYSGSSGPRTMFNILFLHVSINVAIHYWLAASEYEKSNKKLSYYKHNVDLFSHIMSKRKYRNWDTEHMEKNLYDFRNTDRGLHTEEHVGGLGGRQQEKNWTYTFWAKI
jgi:ATP-dependent helicase/DNAse subunit B